MKEKIILEINSNPKIKTYNNIACSFSIIDSQIPNYDQWLCKHFTGLHYRKSWRTVVFNMRYSYHWSCFKSKICFVRPLAYNSFVRMIKKNIVNKYYIYLCVNEKYIPNRIAHNKINYSHDIYIYGFNDFENCFYTMGYDETFNFSTQKIKFKDLYLAYSRRFPNFCCFSFKLKDGFIFEQNNFNQLLFEIYRYLNPRSKYYGINIFNYLISFYNQRLDMRNFKILTEHFYVLMKLPKSNNLFDDLFFNANKLFFMAIKYNNTGKKDVLLKVKKTLNDLKNAEIKLINYYIEKNINEPEVSKFFKLLWRKENEKYKIKKE